MSLTRRLAVLSTLALASLSCLGGSALAAAPTAPDEQALYKSGPTGRYLLDGEWLFRLDPADVGIKQRFQGQTSRSGWTTTSVPNAWNATDESTESFLGSVGWYRKDFKLPSSKSALEWVTRFESVNYRSKVWLNGRPIGSNKGAYLPFELKLDRGSLKRKGVNRLVVRVENKRLTTDFPPAGLSSAGVPTGGWWNYGGILREVYLRKVDGVDLDEVVVRPDLPCRTCAAKIDMSLRVRNPGRSAVRTRVTASFGGKKLSLGSIVVSPNSSKKLSRSLRVARPKLWSPERPTLYSASFEARSDGRGKSRRLQRYQLKSGIRSVKVVDGKWLLNGRPMNFRGVGLHEDDPKLGFAITNRIREREVDETKELGGTVMRSHYPLHPYTHELADEKGVMIWSEVPVYALKTEALASLTVRKLAAKELETNIRTNQNHPSVIVWSIGNELSARPGPVQGFYIARAARSAKKLDPSRPVGYAVAGYRDAGCQPEYGPLDVLGVNEYFGWYPGPNGQIADRDLLSDYLDSVHACYPKKAVLVSEFGAEANRNGPVEEKGTFEFQSDFVNFHLGVYATKPWLTGAIYWALEEFRVRPGWNGGNPYPQSPIHQKGLIGFNGERKPAFAEVQRIFKATDQFGGR